MLSGLLKGRWNKPFWIYDYLSDREYQLTMAADKVISCSSDLARILTEKWQLNPGSIEVLPNVFVPKNEFLNIPPVKISDKVSIAYVGTVEKRKGLIYLAQAFTSLAKDYPHLRLEVIGKIPEENLNYLKEVKKVLQGLSDRVTFHGLVKNSELPAYLRQQDICVLPSLWENFPYTCLEAMSAARAVIGSEAGGMAEMIEHGKNGMLVPPQNAEAIEKAIRYLLENPEKALEMGIEARKKVLETYNADIIGYRMESAYAEAIELHKKKLIPII
jgi:glycosyltransferase involved in cell wall biosynthesis